MPELPAVASSPLAFSSTDGKYFLLPLNAIYFDDKGALKADRWPLYPTYKTIVDPLLDTLRTAGVLVPGPEPPHKPAFTATAKTPGATGVLITIDLAHVVANAGTPPASTADVTVAETDTYTALKPATLVQTIGSAANGGTRPGLVFVSSVAAPALPAAGVYPLAAAAPGGPATADIPKNGAAGTAFTLQTRDGGADAILVSAQIKDVNVGQDTFTLVVTWKKTQNAIAMSGLAAAFAYGIAVQPPAGGFLAPAEGTTTLSGGSDAIAVNPVKASAVVTSK
jgi:hypothetical protein